MKSQLSSERSNGVTRQYHLSNLTELSAKQQILQVTENKKQLIQLIVEDLKTNFSFNLDGHILTVTGIGPTQPPPIQISDDWVTPINDLRSSHEEADVIHSSFISYCTQWTRVINHL